MKRKSIVLSDTEGETTKKAVLTLDELDDGLAGSVRLYNFSHEPLGILSLGIFCDQKVYKAGLTQKSQMLYEFFVNLKEIPKKFSCAIVNFQNAEPKPILYGSSEGNNDEVYANIISEVSGTSSYQKTKEILDKYDVNFVEEEKAEIEKEIDKNLCHENCETCIYKKYFYENSQENLSNVNASEKNDLDYKSQIFGSGKEQFKTDLENVEKNCEFEEKKAPKETISVSTYQKTGANDLKDFDLADGETNKQILFFDRLKPQIDKLFENNPAESNLQDIFPSSKWVKVEYEDEGDFFVFGLLYDEDGNVKYVCYGVPAVFDENPPEELAGYPIWLPLDDEKGFGYWMTYQDAVTGEPIKAILD